MLKHRTASTSVFVANRELAAGATLVLAREDGFTVIHLRPGLTGGITTIPGLIWADLACWWQ